VTSIDALSALLGAASRLKLPVLVLGGGTNLLIDDRGFDGLALKLALHGLFIDEDTGVINVEAAVSTSMLVEQTVALGLTGMAFAAGLPGSVGGGLAGNAGCFGQCLGDILKEATVVHQNGETERIENVDWFQFQYRRSRLLETGAVLVRASFVLPQGDKEVLREESDRNIALRRRKHPLPGAYTAGSFFKNLPPKKLGEHRIAAGFLLDQVGAREMSQGDAAVFERHANIVINRANASCRDVLRLTDAMRFRVLERFGAHLEPEVRYIGPSG
jgi:UDP-N-acetylmuramate dehydrogenase